MLTDAAGDNDPFITSLREPEHYSLGHIPGAVIIGLTEIASLKNLSGFPPDRRIVVYCYNGHKAARVTAALNLPGYDAWNLKFGMAAWTKDTDIAPCSFDEDWTDGYPCAENHSHP